MCVYICIYTHIHVTIILACLLITIASAQEISNLRVIIEELPTLKCQVKVMLLFCIYKILLQMATINCISFTCTSPHSSSFHSRLVLQILRQKFLAICRCVLIFLWHLFMVEVYGILGWWWVLVKQLVW
jgi:hypothetical protein